MFGLNLTPRVKQLAIAIVIASVAAGVATSWLDLPVTAWLALEPHALVGHGGSLPGTFALWQLLTYPWIAVSPLEVVFGIFMLAFFVGDLERAWGERLFMDRLVLLWLGSTAGALLIALLYPPARDAAWLGPSPFLEGLFVAWGFTFPTRTVRIFFILPVRAVVLAWITLALTLLTPVFYGPASLGSVAPYLWAVGIGYLFGNSSTSLRRVWLRIQQARLKRAIERERNQRLH